MNRSEKEQKLYDLVIEEKELTTKELNNIGISSTDLTKFVRLGILERERRGFYKLKDVDAFYRYGVFLSNKKQYNNAMKCFEKCLDLQPGYGGACYGLFNRMIYLKNSEKALEYLIMLTENKDKPYNYKRDHNVYLYLFNFVYGLPREYKYLVENLNLEDLKVLEGDSRYANISEYNILRKAIYEQRFSFVEKKIYQLAKKFGNNCVELTIKPLIKEAKKLKIESNQFVMELIKNKEYYNLFNYLNDKMMNKGLDKKEMYILSLVIKYIEIEQERKVPLVTIKNALDERDAVRDNNYPLALKLSKRYADRYGIKYCDSESILILDDICRLIENIEQNSKDGIGQEPNEMLNSNSALILCQEIIKGLLTGNIDSILDKIHLYMIKMEKSEYEFLILNLIKLSILDGGNDFIEVLDAFTSVSTGNIKIDFDKYLKSFYKCIERKELDKTQIYLDIIKRSNELCKGNIEIEPLEKLLSGKELKEELSISADKKDEGKPNSVSENKKTYSPRENELRRMLKRKHKLVESQKGFVLLGALPKKDRNFVRKIVKEEYPNMHARAIGNSSNKKMILRYKGEERPNMGKLANQREEAFAKGDLDLCLDISLKMLCSNDTVSKYADNPELYARIGLIYASYKEEYYKKRALQCFIIATEMHKEGFGKYNFSEIVMRIMNGSMSNEEMESLVRKSEEELFNIRIDRFNIENLSGFIELMYTSGYDVEHVCSSIGIPSYNVDIIKLALAKSSYMDRNFELGDYYYKQVEKTPSKTNEIKEQLDEIRKNKPFYCNRNTEKNERMVLKLRKIWGNTKGKNK